MDSLHQASLRRDSVGQTTSYVKLIPRAGFYRSRVKPVLDITGGLLLLVAFAPIMAVSTLLIMLSLGTPIIYTQERVGLGGGRFKLYKFRTMTPDRRTGRSHYIGPERRLTHKSRGDPRVTPIGKFLRTVRFDELPQLWNVVKGDMSLVGPRPELPEIVVNYDEWQHQRHMVRPGLTGLWQVSPQNGKPMHECTDVDLKYIANLSFASDISILLRTPAAMFLRRGY